MNPDEEGARATSLLLGKVVKRIARHRERELLIEFEDGSRIIADSETSLVVSITLPD